jgi:hypothetical protein
LWLFLLSSFLQPKVQGSYWLFQAVTSVACIWEAWAVIIEFAYGCPQFCKADVRSVRWSILVMPQHVVETAWHTCHCQLSCTCVRTIFLKLITLYFNSSTQAVLYASESCTLSSLYCSILLCFSSCPTLFEHMFLF